MRLLIVPIVLAALSAAAPAHAADPGMRDLLEQARRAGPVKVFDAHVSDPEVNGTISAIGADAFCVARPLPQASRAIEYCFPIAGVDAIVRPGTGAHNDFTAIWIRGAR